MWRTRKKPISAPRCLESAAIVRSVSAGAPKQDAVHDGFVAVADLRDRLGDGEDNVEVRAIEDVGLAPFNPLRSRQRLALRAVAIAAGVVPDAHVLAAVTLLHVAAERGGPALLNRTHHPPLGE